MGLFNKDEEVPRLPPAPALPDLPNVSMRGHHGLPNLPSFPSANEHSENFNQNMVKSAVSDSDQENSYSSGDNEVIVEAPKEGFDSFSRSTRQMPSVGEEQESNIPLLPPMLEMPEMSEMQMPPQQSFPSRPLPRYPQESQRRTLELTPQISSISSRPIAREQKQFTKSNEPIFVRIDKFQESQKHFEEIKKTTREIEMVLKKIKDTKDKEERELNAWSEDLERIKSRLSDIDANIFNKL